MATTRTPYADLDSAAAMRADAAVAAQRIARISAQRLHAPAPSILFADYPREVVKPQITVSQAAVALAAALHLHLD